MRTTLTIDDDVLAAARRHRFIAKASAKSSQRSPGRHFNRTHQVTPRATECHCFKRKREPCRSH